MSKKSWKVLTTIPKKPKWHLQIAPFVEQPVPKPKYSSFPIIKDNESWLLINHHMEAGNVLDLKLID